MRRNLNCILLDNPFSKYIFEKLNVLLLERSLSDKDGSTIFCDQSLVGHHIKTNESLDAAASRVLLETTGLSNIYLEQFYVDSLPY